MKKEEKHNFFVMYTEAIWAIIFEGIVCSFIFSILSNIFNIKKKISIFQAPKICFTRIEKLYHYH